MPSRSKVLRGDDDASRPLATGGLTACGKVPHFMMLERTGAADRAGGRQYLEEEKVSCDGRWAISRPVLFRPDVGHEVADEVDEQTIRDFLKWPALRKVKKLHVLGFASADGRPREVNDELAWQRAGTVAEAIRRRRPTLEVEKYGLGEDHLTEGVASSRSARIVACVPAVEHQAR